MRNDSFLFFCVARKKRKKYFAQRYLPVCPRRYSKKEAPRRERERCINLLDENRKSSAGNLHHALGQGINDEHVVCANATVMIMTVLEGDSRDTGERNEIEKTEQGRNRSLRRKQITLDDHCLNDGRIRENLVSVKDTIPKSMIK